MAILSISFSSPLLPIPLCLCQAYLFSLHLSLFFCFTSSAALCRSVLLVSNCCIPHFKYPSTHFLSFICRCCFCAFIFLRICFFPDSSFLLPLSSSCSIWLCLSLPPTDFLLVYFPPSLTFWGASLLLSLLLCFALPVIPVSACWKWMTAVRWKVCHWFAYMERGQWVVLYHDDCSKERF